MKTSAFPALPLVFAIAVPALLGAAAAVLAWFDVLGRAPACALAALPLAGGFAVLFRKVNKEDRIARLEAALCRERNARTQADHALAEADLLLARLAARSRTQDPAGQISAIHADLTQLQRQVAPEQPQLAQRLEALCRRMERATASLRNSARAAEPG